LRSPVFLLVFESLQSAGKARQACGTHARPWGSCVVPFLSKKVPHPLPWCAVRNRLGRAEMVLPPAPFNLAPSRAMLGVLAEWQETCFAICRRVAP
jgi:hypothetical protein